MRGRGESEGDGGDGLRPLVSDEGAVGHRDHLELANGQLELELARRVAHLVRVRVRLKLRVRVRVRVRRAQRVAHLVRVRLRLTVRARLRLGRRRRVRPACGSPGAIRTRE